MRLSRHLALALVLIAGLAYAQLSAVDPDWQEIEAKPPPVLKLNNLIPIEVPRSSLRFGVDPTSISLESDGIVRYVVTATSASGAINAIYEAIRCNTGEFKVYARYSGQSWVPARKPIWQPLHDPQRSDHTLIIARIGACVGNGPNRSAAQIARSLRSPGDLWAN